MAIRRNWTWEETLRAFALYFLIPTGQHDKKNKDVIALAESIGRNPNAVVFKLGNIKACDPMRHGNGFSHASKLDSQVWEAYQERGDALLEEALNLLVDGTSAVEQPTVAIEYLGHDLPVGRERAVITTARANQAYFRNALLENYEPRCCVSGLAIAQLLVASHIKPWSEADPATERLTPENGLLLDALHDRAFDKGLMTIDYDLHVVISRKVPKDEAGQSLLWRYAGHRIEVPGKFKPRRDFIEYHNDVIFQR